MTPTQLALHQAHKQRVARINAAAFSRGAPVIRIVPRPVPAPIAVPEWIMREKEAYKPWFHIVECGPARSTIRDVQRKVCEAFNIVHEDLISARRTTDVVVARQVSAYLCRHLTPRSLPDIGRYHGGRDHTTIIHAVRKVDLLIKEDPDFAARVARLRSELESVR